jgi:hypothetical protein
LLVFVLRYGLRPVWSRRPFWLRLFAAEEAPTATTDQETGSYSLGDDRKWTAWTASLLVLSMISGAFGVAGTAVWQGKALLFMIPVVPSVSPTFLRVGWAYPTDALHSVSQQSYLPSNDPGLSLDRYSSSMLFCLLSS